MGTKKRELEFVYNLIWKNKPVNGDEKSNVVGVVDTPATTLDWKTFKKYLLKNSGVNDENVKVSYIDSEEREKPINSQQEFDIALYTFRHKARLGEEITLKLDCLNTRRSKYVTKAVMEEEGNSKTKVKITEEPPEWFVTYMKKFKEEFIEEMSTLYTSKAHAANMHHARKLKADSYKRARKQPLLLGESLNDKELSKSAKIERKLESKLEKLEHKTMKIKAKKMALRGSSDSDVGRSSGRNDTSSYLHQNIVSMEASIINESGTPHMLGGEEYCQTWEISNSGTLPWTSETELRYAWGSQALKPLTKEIPCPPLSPGEKGTITVTLEIPKSPGKYECYWHFYHKGRRFGHWLGCEIIVDPPPVKNTSYSPTYDVIDIQDAYELVLPASWTSPKKIEQSPPGSGIYNPFSEKSTKFAPCFSQTVVNEEEKKKVAIDTKLIKKEIKQEAGTFSDTDNQSLISLSDSNSSGNSVTSEDFVMLKALESPKSETSSPIELVEETFASIPPLEQQTTSTALNAMNVSSLETANTAQIDNLLSKLSLENSTYLDAINTQDLDVDGVDGGGGDGAAASANVEYAPKIETDDIIESTEEIKREINSPDNAEAVAEQIPMDLSNKSNQEEAEKESGYAYIHYQGHKIPISKRHLSAEYLATAETVPESEIKNFKIDDLIRMKEETPETKIRIFRPPTPPPIIKPEIKSSLPKSKSIIPVIIPQTNGPIIRPQFNPPLPTVTPVRADFCSVVNANNYNMTSSTGENRVFVFPQHYPGYEVVHPYVAPITTDDPHESVSTASSSSRPPSVEVMVNDWSTGLNYSSCTMYSNPPTRCANPTPPLSNASRSCSANPASPSQSPNEACGCNADAHFVRSPSPQFDRSQRTSTPFEEYNASASVHTSLGGDFVENVNSANSSTYSNQSKTSTGEAGRGANRVGVPDLLSGANFVATSALNTAKSVFNMFVPPKSSEYGRWQNGHWISTNPESRREKALMALYDMGFYDRNLNATLLARYNDDINAVVADLLQ